MTTLLPDRSEVRTTHLRVEAAEGRARVRSATTGEVARPSLRAVLLDSGPEYARVALVPDGALLLAGDAVALDVTVGPGCRLDLVEPSGTVAYDMRGGSATWDVRLRLGPEAALTWAGEPFVLSAGARVERTTSVVLDEGARLAVRETLVLGRHHERIGALRQRWSATTSAGADVLVEDLDLGGSAHRPGILGGHRVIGSVLALGVQVPGERAAADRFDLEEGGTLWRRLGAHAHQAIPEEAWDAVLATC